MSTSLMGAFVPDAIVKHLCSEARLMRVGAEIGQGLLRQELGKRSYHQPSELPRIAVVNHCAVRTNETNARPSHIGSTRLLQLELTGHAEVSEKTDLGIESPQEPLASSLDGAHIVTA